MADPNEKPKDKENAGAGAGDQGAGKGAAGGNASQGAAGGSDGKGGDKGGEPEKTYTQAELDAALAEDRRARKKSAVSKALKGDKGKKGGDDEAEESDELVKERQRREQLEERLRVRDAQDAVTAAAKTAGFANPEKVYRLVKDDLEFDDSGKPENIKDLIALAKRDFPEELGSSKSKGSADGGEGSNGHVGTHRDMNAFIRHAAGRR